MKSIEDDENEANDGEALDENDFELKINEDLDQHERESWSHETYLSIICWLYSIDIV